MAKMENATACICDICGKIELSKCIGCDPEEVDDLPVGWTKLYSKVTMCPKCTKAYWHGAASASMALTDAHNKESI